MPADSFQPVVLIAGGTGVGTSTLARALVPVVRATGVVGTDSVREALREMQALGRLTFADAYPPDVIDHSTYNAWEAHATADQREYQLQASKARIARLDDHEITLPTDHHGTDHLITTCARQQIAAVMDAVIGVARRAIREGFSLIIEGVHLDLERLPQEKAWHLSPTEDWNRYRRRVFPIFLDCKREQSHYDRVTERDKKHRHRATKESYRRYWHALRTVREDLLGQRDHALVSADTEATIDDLVEKTALTYYAFKDSRGHEPKPQRIDPPTPPTVRRNWHDAGLAEDLDLNS